MSTNNIISICALRPDGSLRVPKLKSDRAILIKVSRGRTIICGSTIAKYIPASRDKQVISRNSITSTDNNSYENAVVRITAESLKKNDLVVWGGHRIYNAVNSFRPIYVVVNIPDSIQNDDMNNEDIISMAGNDTLIKQYYGHVKIPDLYTLARTERLDPYVDENGMTHDLSVSYWLPFEKMHSHPESQHIDIINSVLDMPQRQTRNALVRSSFVHTMKFDLHGKVNDIDGNYCSSFEMPVSTVSGTWLKGLMAEFIMFINGRTDSKELENQNVNIWKANTSETDGAIGPCYGHNYRNYGGTYSKEGFSHDGIDQLMDVINTLRRDPTSRRIVMINWNPSQHWECPLPPCQLYFQFYYDNDKRISLFAMNRSSDVCCAGMWNTAFAALLLGLVSRETGIPAGMLHIQFNDTHIYDCQEELARMHIERIPIARFPIVTINAWPNTLENIKVNTRDAWAYYSNISYPMVA